MSSHDKRAEMFGPLCTNSFYTVALILSLNWQSAHWGTVCRSFLNVTKVRGNNKKKRNKRPRQEIQRKRRSIRWKEWKCCLCWLPDCAAVPCVCVGCALSLRQLINPALLFSPRVLSTVSSTLHNHPAQGWEVQGRLGRRAGRRSCHPAAWYQTILHTPQLCLGLDMPHRDVKLAPSTFLPRSPAFLTTDNSFFY